MRTNSWVSERTGRTIIEIWGGKDNNDLRYDLILDEKEVIELKECVDKLVEEIRRGNEDWRDEKHADG